MSLIVKFQLLIIHPAVRFFINIFIMKALSIARQFYQHPHGILGHCRNVCDARCATKLPMKLANCYPPSDLMNTGIMSYRVSSMYNHNNKIAVVLVAALVLEVSLVVLVQILTLGVHSRAQLSLYSHLISNK